MCEFLLPFLDYLKVYYLDKTKIKEATKFSNVRNHQVISEKKEGKLDGPHVTARREGLVEERW